MIAGIDPYIGAQIQTLVVLLGTFFAVVLWGFFQHRPSE